MIHVFFHKDLDGYCSGAIAKHYFDQQNKEIILIPYDYDMPFPKDILDNMKPFVNPEEAEDIVYFLDIIPKPYDELISYYTEQNKMIVAIDHHKTWIEAGLTKLVPGLSRIGDAGCQLTWEYFYPKQQVPLFVYLLGRFDVWDTTNTYSWDEIILPFHMGMHLQECSPDKSMKIWDNLFDTSTGWREKLIEWGKVCIQYKANQDKYVMSEYSFEAIFEGKRAICLNSATKGSQQFESLWNPEKHDIMLVYTHCKGQYYKVSLYTIPEKNIDVSLLAKGYGGGGHRCASGFKENYITVHYDKIWFTPNPT